MHLVRILSTTLFMLSSVRFDGKIMGLEKGKAAGHPLGAGKTSEQLLTQTQGLEESGSNPALYLRDSPI